MTDTDGSVKPPTCSRAGCRETAKWNINWRNPRIHAKDRVKVWLACDEHRAFLYDYLATRDFPVVATPLGQSVSVVPDREVPSS